MRTFALLALVAGCYEPDVRDCTVSCEVADECADNQVCGSDHMCAAPDMAGRCKAMGSAGSNGSGGSGGSNEDDKVALHVMINGHGKVVIDTLATCDAEGGSHGDCTVMVPKTVVRSLTAIPREEDGFVGWTTAACAGQDATCTVTPLAAIVVGVKFK
jgi:hypothetical protein